MGRTVSSDPNVIALPASPTGFTAGDYVYQTRTGYGSIPSGALATGNFDVGALATPVYASTATTSNELTYVEQLGGSMGSQVAAQLTNTNIVYAYATGNTTTYTNAATVNFRIETTAGAVVVAETSTTMTVQGPFQVSVIALSAGGFCIVASVPNGANFSLSARFYNADGTAATAVLAAGLSLSSNAAVSRLKLQALSDGSVIIGHVGSADITFRRVTTAGFDATFNTTGSYVIASSALSLNNWDFLVDGSNNIQIIYSSASTNAIMRRLNSSGVQQTTSTVTMTGVNAVSIVRTSDGTIRGIVQDSTGITTLTWDGTTAALGTRVITATTPPVGGALAAFAQGASGGYVIFYNTFIGNTNAVGLYFQAFSSANASLATATRVNSAIAVNYRTQFTPIVISGNTRVYFGVFQANAVNYTYGSGSAVPMGVAYFAYSNTTYALVGAPTVNFNYGSQGPFALGAYMRSASTAAVAKFTIATTGTYTITNALGATLIQKTLVDGTNAVQRLSLAPLPNGEFVAVWARNTGVTFISKYSATGALQVGPVTVFGTVGNGNAYQATSVATFANGNILVTYADNATTTTLRFRIYTPSLTVVTSGDIDTNFSFSPQYVSSASFGDGDHIAVMFPSSIGNPQVCCVRSTGTVTARLGSGLTVTTSWFQSQVIGFKSNSFAVMAFANDGSTNIYGYVVRKTGATSFLADSARTFGNNFTNLTGAPAPASPIPTPGTSAYYVGGGISSNAYRLLSVNPLIASTNQLSASETSGTFSTSMSNNCGPTIGYTATGLPVLVANRGLTQFLTLSAITPPMDGNTTSGNTLTTAGVTTTLATANATNYVSAIPHVGDAILIGYIDNNSNAAFVSIVASPFTINATLTAGVDVSTTGLILTPESGYSLQGVSVTGASSGSSGLVQTRGTATLNSNYSAATTATPFDFRNPLSFGTYGTVVGRSVIMGY